MEVPVKDTTLMRNLVSLRTISDITPIKNADRIELAHLDGWQCVVQKGLHSPGDIVLYFEIDSFLPSPDTNPELDPRFYAPFHSFLERSTKNAINPETDEVVTGHPVKTIRLRGTLSQGVVIPPKEFDVLNESSSPQFVEAFFNELGLFKYDPYYRSPNNFSFSTSNSLPFPHQARKTDSIRVQNVPDTFLNNQSLPKTVNNWYATEKLDGTSATYVMTDSSQLICASRNFTVGDDSIYSQMAYHLDLRSILPPNSVLQGEIMGPKIQGNPLDLSENRFFAFNYEGQLTTDVEDFLANNTVPRIELPFPSTVSQALAQVDGMMSTINPDAIAEGVVWWDSSNTIHSELNDRPNFKAINNEFLLKN